MAGRVHPAMAREALRLAKNDRTSAYSYYHKLWFRSTGSLSCGADNKDLQEFYVAEEGKAEQEARLQAELEETDGVYCAACGKALSEAEAPGYYCEWCSAQEPGT